MEQKDFDKVRASVQQQCGSEVMIQLDRGRNKVDIQNGIDNGMSKSLQALFRKHILAYLLFW